MKYTYKQLCQSLAESEYFLRNSRAKVNTSIKGGRADQLEYMKTNFPDKYQDYCDKLMERISKPFDKEALLEPIKTA